MAHEAGCESPKLVSFKMAEAIAFAKTYNLLNGPPLVGVHSGTAQVSYDGDEGSDTSPCDQPEPEP